MDDAKDNYDDDRCPAVPEFADKDTSTSFSLLRMLVPRSSSSRRGISISSSNGERCMLVLTTRATSPLHMGRKALSKLDNPRDS